MLTAELLASALHIPKLRAAIKLPFLLKAAELAECAEDPYRLSCFIAQTAHESGGYRYSKEIWGPTRQQLKYEPPNQLAYRLGNVKEGDGKRYMGRGFIQVTGRANYLMTTVEMRKLYGQDVPNFVQAPEVLAEPLWCALSAAVFWRKNNLNQYCDTRDFLRLTKRINGGTNGLPERMRYQATVYAELMR